MLLALYSLSALAMLISGGGLFIGTYGSRFEGGAGYAGSFAFLVGALFSLAVAILLYKHWNTLALWPRLVGIIGCLPLLTVFIILLYVLTFDA
ncbi:hypothetical protein GCM10027341_04180 [Spirosoma knui]